MQIDHSNTLISRKKFVFVYIGRFFQRADGSGRTQQKLYPELTNIFEQYGEKSR